MILGRIGSLCVKVMRTVSSMHGGHMEKSYSKRGQHEAAENRMGEHMGFRQEGEILEECWGGVYSAGMCAIVAVALTFLVEKPQISGPNMIE